MYKGFYVLTVFRVMADANAYRWCQGDTADLARPGEPFVETLHGVSCLGESAGVEYYNKLVSGETSQNVGTTVVVNNSRTQN